MKKFALVLVTALALATLAPAVKADRAYSYCDPFKSTLCQGLVSLHEFEEGSNTTVKTNEISGGAGRTEPDYGNVAQGVTHMTGSYSFYHTNGAQSYLEMKDTVGFSGTFTLSFWFRPHILPSADTKTSRILAMRDAMGAARYPQLYLYRSGSSTYLRYAVSQAVTDTVTYVQSSSALSVDTWYMVTITSRPTPTTSEPFQYTLGLAINAGTPATVTITYPSRPAMGTLTLGEWSSTSPYEYCDWFMDQLGAWNFSFAPSDATKLYNSGSGKAFPFVD